MSYGGYNDTNYGGGYSGGSGGGGWLAGGGGPSGSQASPGSASKGGSKTNTLRPITIKQILEATPSVPHSDTELRIDGHDITHVILVAQIRSISEQASSMLIYKLDDGTGSIEARQWIDTTSPSAHLAAERCTENTYVRVLGQPKAFGNKKIISAHSIRPVQEFNEVLCHLLEATAVHLYFTRGPPPQAGTSGGDRDIHMGGMGGIGGGSTGYHQGMIGAGGTGATGNEALAGLKPSARKVMQFLQTVDATDGVHVKVIAKSTGLLLSEVMKVKDELVSSGIAFTTIDDDTLAPLSF